MDPKPPHPAPRPLSTARPDKLPANASDREVAHWCANLAAQCVHNWGAAQSWLETISGQMRDLDARVAGLERGSPPTTHVSELQRDMHDRQESFHDLQEVASRMERAADKVEQTGSHHVPLNSERVREVVETVVTRRGYDELTRDQRDRRSLYAAIFVALLAAVLGILGGRLSAPAAHQQATPAVQPASK